MEYSGPNNNDIVRYLCSNEIYPYVLFSVRFWDDYYDGACGRERTKVWSNIYKEIASVTPIRNNSCIFYLGWRYFNRICVAWIRFVSFQETSSENIAHLDDRVLCIICSSDSISDRFLSQRKRGNGRVSNGNGG